MATTTSVALMIDRSGNMYEVEVTAEEDHFRRSTTSKGSLWGSECSDALPRLRCDLHKGALLKNSPFVHRFRQLVELVKWSEDLCSVNDDLLSTRRCWSST